MNFPKPLSAGLAVVVLWAAAFPAIRVAAPELGVAGLSVVRIIGAAVVLSMAAPLVGVRLPRRQDLGLIFACGVVGMSVYQVLLNWGELEVAAGPASIIIAAAPLVSVAIAAAVFHEKMSTIRIAGSVVALGGVATVALARGGAEISSSVWIVIAAAVTQGVYHPLMKPLLRRYSGMEVATYAMVAGAISILPLVTIAMPHIIAASSTGWWAAAFLAVLPSAAGFVLWGYAVAHLPMATATSFLYLVPAAAIGIAYLWLGEVPVILELTGGAIVLVGVVTVGLGDRLRGRLARAKLSAAVSDSGTTTAQK